MDEYQTPNSRPSLSFGPRSPYERRCTFTGTDAEYFQIWIVNFALTILTLGIYGPWAKVKREQYFLNHTLIDGHSFEYTADPVNILKGRLILFAFLFTYTFTYHVAPSFYWIFLLISVFVFPWIMTQAIKFRARYTSYRNIPFQFSGTYGKSFRYFIFNHFLAAATFGILLPWAKHREREYVVSHLRYGKAHFEFGAQVADFVKIYAGVFFFVIVPLVIFGIWSLIRTILPIFASEEFQYAQGNPEYAQNVFEKLLYEQSGMTLYVLGFGALLAIQVLIPYVFRTVVSRTTWNNASIDPFYIFYSISIRKYLWIAFSNFFLRIFTFCLASPYCAVRMHQYKVDNFSIVGRGSFDAFLAGTIIDQHGIGDALLEMSALDFDLGF